MPIVHFTRDAETVPAEAVNVREGTDGLTLYDTHVGLCLRERERNMHDDSDFYMLVWNEELEVPEEICFASTRGWCYPSMASHVDATAEVIEKWDA